MAFGKRLGAVSLLVMLVPLQGFAALSVQQLDPRIRGSAVATDGIDYLVSYAEPSFLARVRSLSRLAFR
jgi:hypothetical protein